MAFRVPNSALLPRTNTLEKCLNELAVKMEVIGRILSFSYVIMNLRQQIRLTKSIKNKKTTVLFTGGWGVGGSFCSIFWVL